MNGFLRGGVSEPADPESLKIATLTLWEIEVVALIGQGLRNKQIGECLSISETTVRHHLTSIFDKLGIADRLELMMYAYQHGLARVPQSFRPTERLKD
jgi:DNA-binding NarL/FixJ family response regulator